MTDPTPQVGDVVLSPTHYPWTVARQIPDVPGVFEITRVDSNGVVRTLRMSMESYSGRRFIRNGQEGVYV